MRSSSAHRPRIPFFIDAAIGLALVGATAFFLIVMDYCFTGTALTRAQLRLLEPEVTTAQSAEPTPTLKSAALTTKNPTRETKEYSRWWTEQTH